MKKIVFATGNEGKLREIRMILADLEAEVISMKEAGADGPIEENGTTFEENALIKARTVCARTGLPTLADDSGLVIDHLGGEPGVWSARYLGEDTPYDVKNRIILERRRERLRLRPDPFPAGVRPHLGADLAGGEEPDQPQGQGTGNDEGKAEAAAMKILVMSDSHGRSDGMRKAIRREAPLDAIIHLGDLQGGEHLLPGLAK